MSHFAHTSADTLVRTFLQAIAPRWTRQEERQQARSTGNQVSYQQLELDFTGSAVVDAAEVSPVEIPAAITADVSTDDAELPTLISCIDIALISNLSLRSARKVCSRLGIPQKVKGHSGIEPKVVASAFGQGIQVTSVPDMIPLPGVDLV